jgi:prevent-host-death family protein
MDKTYHDPACVAVGELKAKLSEYLRLVKGGRELLVTERGRPIARLAPIGDEVRNDRRVEALVAAGTARPPLRPLSDDFFQRAPESHAFITLDTRLAHAARLEGFQVLPH